MRVINTTPESQELKRDTCLVNLESVEMCDKPAKIQDPSVQLDQSEVDPAAKLLQSVPDELTDEQMVWYGILGFNVPLDTV